MGRNNGDFHGLRHSMMAINKSTNRVVAIHDEQSVGSLDWDAKTGEVEFIHVHPNYRRKGVATSMWKHAKANAESMGMVEPTHSEDISEQGKAWAEKVGD
jgi:ribosomal protein S18 acetylase RimI-like enzyme